VGPLSVYVFRLFNLLLPDIRIQDTELSAYVSGYQLANLASFLVYIHIENDEQLY